MDGGGAGGAGGGWYTLSVGSPPILADATLDTARAVTKVVPRAGGTLETTASNGTTYRLTVPAGAVTEDTSITMTPLASLAVTDLETDGFAGVDLEPDGLSFVKAATLAVIPPAGTAWPVDKEVPVGFGGPDHRVALALLEPQSAEVRFSLMHFSSYALLFAKKGFDASLNPVRHRLGGDAEERIQSAAAEQLGRERIKQLLGSVEGGDWVVGLDELRDQYVKEVLTPRLAAAGDSCAAGRLALQTLLGYERQLQLLGASDDSRYPRPFNDLAADVIAKTAVVCMKEEYDICRDEHIITRILPAFLGVLRTAQLLGIDGWDVQAPALWLLEAEGYVRKCLQFELRFDGSVAYAQSEPAHTMSESVTSSVAIGYGVSFVDPLPDTPDAIARLEALITGNSLAPLVASNYRPAYAEDCWTLGSSQAKNGGLLVSFLTFTPGVGSATERAKVTDFGVSFGIDPNLSEHTYTARTRNTQGQCVDPSTVTSVESFSTTAGSSLLSRYATPENGAYITGWTVQNGSDIAATKDISFTDSSTGGSDTTRVTVHLILFHKPVP